MKGSPASVRLHLDAALRSGETIFIPSVALFKLCYGAAKSSQPQANQKAVEMFLEGSIALLPFERGDAEAAGKIRAELEKAGTPIGEFDLLIAGQAVARGLTVVTSNLREFRRVRGLAWEDWARA